MRVQQARVMRAKIHRAYLGLGSNMGNSCQILARAVEEIGCLPGLRLEGISPVFQTEPQDYGNQPWFANACVKLALASHWQPDVLLKALLQIENRLGRERKAGQTPRFGPRAIDIDLLLFDKCQSADEHCLLPHPRMQGRAFVLLPLYTLEPGLEIMGHTIYALLGRLNWTLQGWRIFQKQDGTASGEAGV